MQFTQIFVRGYTDFMAASDTTTHSRKKTPVVETSRATPSGVNSLFPGKVIMDPKNGINLEVFTGYG